jgi:glycosyltransferase involved in cell wall biosynthesis
LTKQIAGDAVDIFHGVNNELPYNIHRTKTKSVMTVHDLIVFRFPAYYQPIDRLVYTMKSKYGLMRADKIVAISKQTKEDIVNFQHVDASRIDVVYQGCDPIYYQQYDAAEIAVVKKKYGLPEEYMVSVGTIEERKNVLSVVEALHKGRIDFPFVIVGRPTAYSSKVKKYISENKVKNRIILCHSVDMRDLPALYQGAKLFIYPSFFEGFGIPVLEALYSRVPVITTRGGCFSEAGGPSSLYSDPMNTEEIGENINKVLNDSALRLKMISDGYEFAQRFREETIAENMMRLYLSIM